MLQTVIETSFRYPEQPIPDDSESREQDRVICSANIIHQVKLSNLWIWMGLPFKSSAFMMIYAMNCLNSYQLLYEYHSFFSHMLRHTM